MVTVDVFLRVMDVFFIFFCFDDNSKYKVLHIAKLVIKQFVITRHVCHLWQADLVADKGSRPGVVRALSWRDRGITAVAA